MAAVTPLGAHTLQRSCYESTLTSPYDRCAGCLRPKSHCPADAIQRAGESPGCSFVDDKRSTKPFRHWPAEPELRVRHRSDGAQWIQYRRFCERRDALCRKRRHTLSGEWKLTRSVAVRRSLLPEIQQLAVV